MSLPRYSILSWFSTRLKSALICVLALLSVLTLAADGKAAELNKASVPDSAFEQSRAAELDATRGHVLLSTMLGYQSGGGPVTLPLAPLPASIQTLAFSGGDAFSISSGYRLPLWSSGLGLSGGLGYQRRVLEYAAQEPVPVIVGGRVIDALLPHSVQTTLHSMILSVDLSYTLFKRIEAFGGVGAWVFNGEQSIASRDSFAYFSGGRANLGARPERAFSNGTRLFQGFFQTGLRWSMPLSKNQGLHLRPALTFQRAFQQAYNQGTSQESRFVIGVDLVFQTPPPPPRPMVIDSLIQRDTSLQILANLRRDSLALIRSRLLSTKDSVEIDVIRRTLSIEENYTLFIPKPAPLLNARLGISFRDAAGAPTTSANTSIETTERTIYVAFPTMVEFLPGSTQLVGPSSTGRANAAPDDPREYRLRLNGAIIDTLATRLRADSTLNLVVSAESQDSSAELQTQRFDVLRNGLVLHGIEPERVTIRTSHSRPRGLTSTTDIFSIVCSGQTAPDPVRWTDTVRSAALPIVEFSIDAASENGIRNWELIAEQPGRVVARFGGLGDPPRSFLWNPPDSISLSRLVTAPLSCRVVVRDEDGAEFSTLPGNISFFEQQYGDANAISKRSAVYVLSNADDVRSLSALARSHYARALKATIDVAGTAGQAAQWSRSVGTLLGIPPVPSRSFQVKSSGVLGNGNVVPVIVRESCVVEIPR